MSAKDVLKLREKLDMSQEQLAKALGLAGRSVIFRWESGQRRLSEPMRRLFCLINDLSKKDALKLMSKISSYGRKNGKK